MASTRKPLDKKVTKPIQVKIYSPSEEIRYGPACWLWDYLRRSKSGGLFLPSSGGIDSCATALIVFSMCELVILSLESGDKLTQNDVARLIGEKSLANLPKTAQDLCNKIFHTCYMGTENSSKETRQRAKDLANMIGSYHLDTNIDGIVRSFLLLFETVTGILF